MEYDSQLLQKTGREISPTANLEGHSNSVDAVLFHPQKHNQIVSGSFDHTLIFWDIDAVKATQKVTAHEGGIWSMDFNQEGSVLATGSADKSIKLWDTKSMKEITKLSGHKDHVYSVKINEATNRLFSSSEDGTVKIWDLKSHKELSTIKPAGNIIYNAICDKGGKRIFTTDSDGYICVFDAAQGTQLTKVRTSEKENAPKAVHASFDPEYANDIFVALDNGRFQRYSYLQESFNLIHEEPAHLDPLRSINLHKDLQRLVTTCKDGTAKLWNTTNNKLLGLFVGFTDAASKSAFPNQTNPKVVAISSWDQTVKIFQLE